MDAQATTSSTKGLIEFWFDFSSPYAYFASLTVDDLARRHGYRVAWRPFMLGMIFKVTGMQPLNKTPVRGDYARHDWARLARRHDVRFAKADSVWAAAA